MSTQGTDSLPSSDRSPAHVAMMSLGEACAVIVRSETGKSTSGQVRIQIWDAKARRKRAARFWIYSWCAAMFAVILPLLHFFLVPALMIAGPIGAWVISTQGASILGGQADCPDCGAFLPLSAASDAWPLSDLCAACQHRMKIEKAEKSGGKNLA